jgi:hypothetical protein
MNGKKVLGFLLCRSAFTQRNLTSIGLVVIFFVVYVLAGGKITTGVPSMKELEQRKAAVESSSRETILSDKKGLLETEDTPKETELLDLSEKDSKKVLGIVPSKERRAREASLLTEGRLFTEEERAKAEKERINSSGLIKGEKFVSRREQLMLDKSEKKPKDSLTAIEERLKIRRQ